MNGRLARLKQEWLLRGWADVPWALVNWRNGDFRELSRDGFYVAQSCDGETDFDSMAFLPRHREILNKYIDAGIQFYILFTIVSKIKQKYALNIQ